MLIMLYNYSSNLKTFWASIIGRAKLTRKSHVESFNTNILVYNRVPKCGSIWMTRLLYLLGAGDHNNYNVESPYEPGEKPWLTQPQEEIVISHLDVAPKPTVYIRHQYFIDFEEHQKKRPIYINVIRDPIEKFRSFYYFIRNGNLEGDGADVVMSEKKKQMTIDECVALKVSTLTYTGHYSCCIGPRVYISEMATGSLFLRP